jgi:oxygen-independent coproporphyrinogen-3 oxidase
MNREQIRAYLDAHLDEQPGTKIQYGHPSPRFWQPLALSVSEVAALRHPGRKLVLYLHIPFCPQTDPPACGFCLFARSDLEGPQLVSRYLDALLAELRLYAEVFGGQELACIYFGGGTPNVLRPAEYGRVMAEIRRVFHVPAGIEVTLEGLPELFRGERLDAMAAAGVTRISAGAQQLKPHLLRYSGRHHTAAQVLAAVEHGHRLGMAVNVDLIVGWFEQVTADLEDDLTLLDTVRPEGISVHPITLAGESWFAREKDKLPGVRETCMTYLHGRRHLEEQGYWGSNYAEYNLLHPPRGANEGQYLRFYRDILRYDRLGVGFGANSLFAGSAGAPGLTWRNVAAFNGYYERIDAGLLPVAEGFRFAAGDLRLLYVLKGLEGTPFLYAQDYARDLGGDLAADFAAFWAELGERGWLAVRDDGRYEVVGEGLFYLPVIQRCISNDRNDALRAAAAAAKRKGRATPADGVPSAELPA